MGNSRTYLNKPSTAEADRVRYCLLGSDKPQEHKKEFSTYGIALFNGVPKDTQDNKDRKQAKEKPERLFVCLCILTPNVEA